MVLTRELFDAWREPRLVHENPTRLDNPLWTTLVVEEPINAYQVNKQFGYERVYGAGPTWCFDRFGRTSTVLADGRTVHIAGEHEDYYDPDFYIYNDIVVVAPDGDVEAIYGYPRDVFPPTDFHTATLDGDHIWIVGNLGYANMRAPHSTQVCRLDLRTMAIEPIATTGEPPGWIHKHVAELADNTIVVRGGLLDLGPSSSLEENIDDWALDLATRTWARRTARDWQRWAIRRTDEKRNMMWEIRQLKWHADHPDVAIRDRRDTLKDELGGDPDLALVDALYRFDDAEVVEDRDSDYNVFRIRLDGVLVRFTEEGQRIAAMVEGQLAEPRLLALQEHVLRRASALHGTPWERCTGST